MPQEGKSLEICYTPASVALEPVQVLPEGMGTPCHSAGEQRLVRNAVDDPVVLDALRDILEPFREEPSNELVEHLLDRGG